MTSTSGSTTHSPVETAAVVAHGRIDVADAVELVRAVAERAGVELVDEPERAQLAIAVGGDGTILRTLARLLGTGVPVIGINFGRVGFLASIAPERLEGDLARVFAGEYRIVELPTLELELDGQRHVAVNDAVVTSAELGRLIELEYAIGREDLGVQPCDGLICATPQGSTAYNLSNGGPVLVWGLDALVVTFVAPHTLHARPLVVGRGVDVVVENRSADVGAAVLADGHRSGNLAPERALSIRLGEQRSLLATLPETTFFGRYRETFTS